MNCLYQPLCGICIGWLSLQFKQSILSASTKEAGAWLHAFPLFLGLRIHVNDDIVGIAVGLCLGAPFYTSHTCCCCGEKVNNQGVHGPNFQRSGQPKEATLLPCCNKNKTRGALATANTSSLLMQGCRKMICFRGAEINNLTLITFITLKLDFNQGGC